MASDTTFPIPPRRTGSRRRIAFAGSASSYAAMFVAAGAPTPLLAVLAHDWGFGSGLLTIAFAAYAVALLGALLVAGSLSDYLGRRPVLVTALLVECAATLLFVFAPSVGWIIFARVVQGAATGGAVSAFSAELIELAPPERRQIGAVVGSAAAPGGLGLGALLAGAAVQFVGHPRQVMFVVLAAIMVVGVAIALWTCETTPRRPGALRSLRPHVAVPHAARNAFRAGAPVQVGAWMLAALFMGLSPTILRVLFHHAGGLLAGSTAFLEPGAAGIASALLGSVDVRITRLIGAWGVALGTTIIVVAVLGHVLALLWLGGVIGGVGFGASFSGTARTLMPLAGPSERAGLFAALFLVAYLAFAVPAVVAGQLAGPFGLKSVVVGYGVAIVACATAGLLLHRSPAAVASRRAAPVTE